VFEHWPAFQAKNPEDIRNLALALVGLLAAVVGLPLAWVRTAAADRQSRAVDAQANTAEKGHVTERFSRAVEQLGDGQLAVRLGAISALEQVAKDSPEDFHWPIMETLTAFVRQGDRVLRAGEDKESKKSEAKKANRRRSGRIFQRRWPCWPGGMRAMIPMDDS